MKKNMYAYVYNLKKKNMLKNQKIKHYQSIRSEKLSCVIILRKMKK